MKFFVVALAAVASASPMAANGGGSHCGNGMELNCCNREVSTKSADVGPNGSGLLSGILNGALGGGGTSLLGDCSPLDLASRTYSLLIIDPYLVLTPHPSHRWWCYPQRPDLPRTCCLLQPLPGRRRWWSHQRRSSLRRRCRCCQLSSPRCSLVLGSQWSVFNSSLSLITARLYFLISPQVYIYPKTAYLSTL